VSFARRTVIIRSGIERSGPAAPRFPAEPELPVAEPEPPAAEPEPTAARAPEPPPEPESTSNGDPAVAAPPPAAPAYPLAGAAAGAPGAPPDSGTLARVIPGLLIVMAIGIALVVAGIVGVGKTPATSDDTQPPSLEEPVRDVDTTGTPPTPPTPSAPGSEAAADTN
jgi:hypothetical protein